MVVGQQCETARLRGASIVPYPNRLLPVSFVLGLVEHAIIPRVKHPITQMLAHHDGTKHSADDQIHYVPPKNVAHFGSPMLPQRGGGWLGGTFAKFRHPDRIPTAACAAFLRVSLSHLPGPCVPTEIVAFIDRRRCVVVEVWTLLGWQAEVMPLPRCKAALMSFACAHGLAPY